MCKGVPIKVAGGSTLKCVSFSLYLLNYYLFDLYHVRTSQKICLFPVFLEPLKNICGFYAKEQHPFSSNIVIKKGKASETDLYEMEI